MLTTTSRRPFPLTGTRLAICALTVGDVALTLPQQAREMAASLILLQHAPDVAYVLVRLALTPAALAVLAICGRDWPRVERAGLAVVLGALVAANVLGIVGLLLG